MKKDPRTLCGPVLGSNCETRCVRALDGCDEDMVNGFDE